MGNNFNVEIRKNCKVCGKLIIQKRFRTFCSKKCRTRNYTIKYRKQRNILQRKKRDKIADIPLKDKIQCKICGKWYRQVGSHIFQVHKITARKYREEYSFDVKRGQLPEDYRKIKSDCVFKNGTVNNLKVGKKYWFKKGQKDIGKYKRSNQTLERLKKVNKT